MEVWIDIKNYEGYYQISSNGNVKSLGAGNNRNAKQGLLKRSKDRFGYERVNLWKNKLSKVVKVHRLVGEHFIPNPDKKRTINHINGIKTDNRVINLEWNTHSENHLHAFRTGIRDRLHKFGKDNPKAKLIIQIDRSDNVVNQFYGQKEAERVTGVSQGCISMVCNGVRSTAGGFKWAFK